ncbi:hypothetical protein [Duganella sp. Dugasp56]|uniref:hypothetical protein n=1 Tax=Duganella sp. Dugasp56 TaxID=3243046 RepID=UPI0039AFB5B6
MVPAEYEGLWRRKGIWRSNGSSDLTTQVWWFQAARYHIDLRIPVGRAGISGFAGETVVDGDRCEWRPAIACPAISADLDAGWMRFDDADHIHEEGLDHSYEEDWYREPTGAMHGARLEDPDSDELAYLLIGERWMAWARGSPSGACEITVYHHDQQWQAVASTLDAAPSLTTPTLQQALQWNSGDMVMPALAPGRAWRVSSK